MEDVNSVKKSEEQDEPENGSSVKKIPVIYQNAFSSNDAKALEELQLYYGKNPDKLKDANIHIRNKG